MADSQIKDDPSFTITFLEKTINVYERVYHKTKKHHTRRYREALKIMRKRKTIQMDIERALKWYFDTYRKVPIREKKSVQEIYFAQKSRIVVLRMGLGDQTYKHRNHIARQIGWYFYVTGTDLPESKLCKRINTIHDNGAKFVIDSFELRIKQDLEAVDREAVLDGQKMELESIVCGPNENLFNLRFGGLNFFMDNGVFWGRADEFFAKLNIKPDVVFLSHSHNDHMQGVIGLLKHCPDVPLIMSKTTLAFYLYRMTYGKREFNQEETKLIQNALIVKNGDSIPITSNGERKGMVRFYFAGHMPGALMVTVEYDGKTFFYTGDYTYYSYDHIAGVSSVRSKLPSKVDLMLVDGSFASEEFKPPREQIGFLRRMAKVKADYQNKVLIVGDPASIGILIYLDLHRFFIWLKEDKHYEDRPIFHLSNEILDYAKILTAIPEDLHVRTADKIRRQFNPFCSAMIHWIKHGGDKRKTVGKLRSHKQKRAHFVIFENQNLDSHWVIDFYKSVADYKYNAVYLAGRVSNPAVVELLSGEDDITLESKGRTVNIHNRAAIQNRMEPDNIMVLHGDYNQLVELVNDVRPREIAFFHTNPRNLISIRNKLERFKSIRQTHAFYKDERKIIPF